MLQPRITSVRVDLGDRSYPIHVGPVSRGKLRDCFDQARSRQLAVIADESVARLHLATLRAALPAEPFVVTFPPGEAAKSLSVVEGLCGRLAEAHIERSSCLLTLGGGVAGDLGGFIASVWLRGVPYIQVPTTLLAAVDASVGGKTGVNLPAGKNLVGSFYQPRAVIIDTDFLQTLSDRDFAAGLGESVKHAAIRDPAFVEWHEANAEAIVARQPEVVADLITRNCRIKAEVVARDEREAGLRAILNHGHTIGHAIEHAMEYELRHGECVALGMVVENEISRSRGWLPNGVAERIKALLGRLGLPGRLPRRIEAADIEAACRVDKKARGGAVHFQLIRGLGQPAGAADVSAAEMAAALETVQPA